MKDRLEAALSAAALSLGVFGGPAAGLLLGATANRILPALVGVALGLAPPLARRWLPARLRIDTPPLALLWGGACVLAVVVALVPGRAALDLGARASLGLGGAQLLAIAGAGGGVLVAVGLAGLKRLQRLQRLQGPQGPGARSTATTGGEGG